MIISRTPLRISFVGGGTDLPSYSDRYGGHVISTTIDKFVYVTVAHKFDGRVSVRYSEKEDVATTEGIKHTIVRECLRLFGIKGGVEIVTISDVPMKGTGLGSSSALAVGLLNALCAYTDTKWSKERLAEAAITIEIDRLKAPIGKQDQYATAFGGFNHLLFDVHGTGVDDLRIPSTAKKIQWLEDNTMLFCLERPRDSNDILSAQAAQMEENIPLYTGLTNAVYMFLDWFDNEMPDDAIGGIMNAAWETKKGLCSRISDSYIDETYSNAIGAGALGGKVAGAGGGGFLLLVVPKERREAIRNALFPLIEMPFKFTMEGSTVIYNA